MFDSHRIRKVRYRKEDQSLGRTAPLRNAALAGNLQALLPYARAAAVLETPPLFVASLGDDAREMLGTTFGGPAGWLKDAESSSYVIKA